ncbi:MAG: small multi-drug export protein [Planctomycetes bacterium]|nr:small multi-drug export protein [Planctomycetota bacterium]
MDARELDLDAQRLRYAVLGVATTTLAAVVLYVIESGLGGIGPLMLAATAVFFSKLAIFGGNIEQYRFNPWELGLIAWVLDAWVTCALLLGISSFKRLPLAGKALAEAHLRAGNTLREYPGLRRLAFSGIAVLVFLPIPGSGAVTGTLVGQLVGLSRIATLVAVLIGAALAVVTYAAVAAFLGAQFEAMLTNPWVLLASIAGLCVFCWLAWLKVKRELQRS